MFVYHSNNHSIHCNNSYTLVVHYHTKPDLINLAYTLHYIVLLLKPTPSYRQTQYKSAISSLALYLITRNSGKKKKTSSSQIGRIKIMVLIFFPMSITCSKIEQVLALAQVLVRVRLAHSVQIEMKSVTSM